MTQALYAHINNKKIKIKRKKKAWRTKWSKLKIEYQEQKTK
jgi:hypothetical protein